MSEYIYYPDYYSDGAGNKIRCQNGQFIKEEISIKTLKENKLVMNNTKSDKDCEAPTSLLDELKSNSVEATLRSTTTVGVAALKGAAEKILAHEGIGGEASNSIMKFLNTEHGEALLRLGLGSGFHMLPFVQQNDIAKSYAKELRVSGMDKGMTKAMSLLYEFILPALTEAYQSVPALQSLVGDKTKSRVDEALTPKRVSTPSPQNEQTITDEPEPLKPTKAQAK